MPAVSGKRSRAAGSARRADHNPVDERPADHRHATPAAPANGGLAALAADYLRLFQKALLQYEKALTDGALSGSFDIGERAAGDSAQPVNGHRPSASLVPAGRA